MDCHRLVATGFIVLLACSFLSCGGGDSSAPSTTGAPSGDAPAPPGLTPGALPSLADLPAPEPLAPEPDKVVARVNGAEIVAEQVYQLAEHTKSQMQGVGQSLSEESEKMIRQVALELLIDNELMIQDAREQGMSVDPTQLEQKLQEIRDRHGTKEAFATFLDRLELSEEQWRSDTERNLLAQQYARSVGSAATVTEDEVRAFYDGNLENFIEGEKIRASHILLRSAKTDPEEKRARARKRAEEARERLLEGEEFAVIAKEYSQSPSAARGGDIGFFPRGAMVPRFEEMAFSLPVGETSPVFETRYGFNIIAVTGKQEPKPVAFEEIKPQLMLQLAKVKEAELVRERVAELRVDAEVEYLDPEMVAPPADEGTPS